MINEFITWVFGCVGFFGLIWIISCIDDGIAYRRNEKEQEDKYNEERRRRLKL